MILAKHDRAPLPILVLGLALAVTAGDLAAQEPGPEQGRDCICLGQLADSARTLMVGSRRARLGIALGEPAQVDGRPGVTVAEVPEGTPARRAGLRAGDVIVGTDGRDLGTPPTARLLEAIAAREPGDTVAVTFFREGEEETAQVVTEAAPSFQFRTGAPGFEFRSLPNSRSPHVERLEIRPGRVLGPDFVYRHLLGEGLGLAAMNEGLGQYFDTDQGVLITEIDDDSPLELRAGDVILAIGGREVRDPAHARSILSSYLEDEPITFAIVREGRRTEVTGRRGG